MTRVTNIIQKMLSGWNRVIADKRLMFKLVLITLINFLLSILVAKLIISSLHLSISTAALVVFTVLGSLSLFINITPANLGIKELVYIFSLKVIGFNVSEILMIALVDRSILFIILFVSWVSMGKLKKLPHF